MKPPLETFFVVMVSLVACEMPEPTSQWALTNVVVVDVAAGREIPAQTIVIDGRRIASVRPTATSPADTGLRKVDGTGKYVIPGLWDMHAHVPPTEHREERLRDLVNHGVLGVRVFMPPLDSVPSLRTQIQRVGLRAFFTGPANIEAVVGDWERSTDWYEYVVTPNGEDAREEIKAVTQAGLAEIKVHDFTSRAFYLAAAVEANELGVHLVGHVPAVVSVDEAIQLGQRSIEHLGGLFTPILRECGSRPKAASWLHDLYLDSGMVAYPRGMASTEVESIVRGFDSDACDRLLGRLAADSIWQIPTLVLFRQWAQSGGRVLGGWSPTEADQAALWDLYGLVQQVVGRMARRGVPLLAGTDNVPESTLQDELELMVDASLSPSAALRAATLNPAVYFGLTDSVGVVARGMVADLVVLDASPLADIGNARLVHAVIQSGVYRPAVLHDDEQLR